MLRGLSRKHTHIDDYMRRHIWPQIDRARAAGIAPARLDELWHQALDMTDFDAQRFPGACLRDLIDAELDTPPAPARDA